ncbi:tissue reproteinration [Mactra antiquata]
MTRNQQSGSELELTNHDMMQTDVGTDEVDLGLKVDMKEHGVANMYVGKRNFIHQLMDVALMMANVSQLKSLLSMDTHDKYFFPLLVFIVGSIVLQVVFTLCMLIIWSIERKFEEYEEQSPQTSLPPPDESRRILADRLDRVGNFLVLLIIISNVFITGFGVESHSKHSVEQAGEIYMVLSNGTKVKMC